MTQIASGVSIGYLGMHGPGRPSYRDRRPPTGGLKGENRCPCKGKESYQPKPQSTRPSTGTGTMPLGAEDRHRNNIKPKIWKQQQWAIEPQVTHGRVCWHS